MGERLRHSAGIWAELSPHAIVSAEKSVRLMWLEDAKADVAFLISALNRSEALREIAEARLVEEFANMDATMKGWDALCARTAADEEKAEARIAELQAQIAALREQKGASHDR